MMDQGQSRQKFCIVDGFNILFRAFYAVPSLTRSDQTPVGALYGFLSSLAKVVELESPDHLLIALDSPGPGVRHSLYADYKANRGAPPEELLVQIKLLTRMLDELGVMYDLAEGYEADDIIAAYTKLASSDGYDVVIVSSDKDLMQLVDEQTCVLNPGTLVRSTISGVKEKFGVPPSMMQEYLMLVGDASDNVPGVKGVGPKTAVRLLEMYGSLDAVYAHKGDLKPRVQTSLDAFQSFAVQSRELVRLRTEVPISHKLEDVRWLGVTQNHVDHVVQTYECFSLKSRLSGLVPMDSSADLKCADTLQEFNEHEKSFCEEVLLHGFVSAVPYANGYIVSSGSNTPFIIEKEWPRALQKLMSCGYVRCVFWSSRSFCDHVLPSYEDVQVLAFLTYGILSQDALFQHPEFQANFQGLSADAKVVELCKSLQMMADRCLLALSKQKLVAWYRECEMPLLNALSRMEKRGICVSINMLHEMQKRLESDLDATKNKLFALANKEFNPGSSQQVAVVLYDELKLLPERKNRSTDVRVLEAIKDTDFGANLLHWRHIHKLLSTYVKPLQKKAQDGVISTHFSSVETLSGRLASSDPNLQNIPVRTEEGVLLRRAFCARPEHLFLIFDYSQIELRLLAHYAGEGALLGAFRDGKDIHTATASLVFNIEESAVTKHQRYQAKTFNFGIIYGMGASMLAQRLGVSHADAKELLDNFFERYPEILLYKQSMQEQAERYGYVKTVFGRPCFLPFINSMNTYEKSHALRQAINIPLQASNADIMKKVLSDLPVLLDCYPGAEILLQVHDEIIVEAPRSLASELQASVRLLMQEVISLKVDLIVDSRVQSAWHE